MSALTSTDFRHGPLADKNTRKRELACKKFSGLFFVHVLIYQFETWYIHFGGSTTHRVKVSSQSGHSDLIYSQKCIKVIFIHKWPQQLYRAFRFGAHTFIASVLNCTAFPHGWAIFGPLLATNTQKGDLSRAPHHPKVFWAFFLHDHPNTGCHCITNNTNTAQNQINKAKTFSHTMHINHTRVLFCVQ